MLRVPVVFESEVEPLLTSLASHMRHLEIDLDLRHHTTPGELTAELVVVARRPGSDTIRIDHPGVIELHFGTAIETQPGEHVYLPGWPARSTDTLVAEFARRLKEGRQATAKQPLDLTEDTQPGRLLRYARRAGAWSLVLGALYLLNQYTQKPPDSAPEDAPTTIDGVEQAGSVPPPSRGERPAATSDGPSAGNRQSDGAEPPTTIEKRDDSIELEWFAITRIDRYSCTLPR
ncbi:MAG: hypothetical protein AAF513_11430 [Pseudomonadota bacterium]